LTSLGFEKNHFAMENDHLRNLEIDRVIRFLEYEINCRRAEAMRPGWTTWAILGAMASLLWLLFALLDTNRLISWQNILYLTLSLSVSFDLFFLLIKTLPSGVNEHMGGSRRFEYFSKPIGSFFVALLLRTGALLSLIILLSPRIDNFVEFFCWLFLWFSLIEVAILLVVYYFKIPIVTKAKPRFKWLLYVFTTVWLISGAIASVGLFTIIRLKIVTPSIPEWRIAFILFGMSILLLIFSRSKPPSILLSQLDHIRQKLSLGQLDLNSAKHQVDLIIHGLTLSDILQSNINGILVSVNNLRSIYEKHDSELRLIERIIDKPQESLKEEDITMVEAVTRSLTERDSELKSAKLSLSKNQNKLSGRLAFFSGMSEDLVPDIDSVCEEIDKEIKELNDMTEQAFGRLTRMRDKMDKSRKRLAQQPHAQGHS
jgi:hypothetical protein